MTSPNGQNAYMQYYGLPFQALHITITITITITTTAYHPFSSVDVFEVGVVS